jgi:hypothetical protein
MVRILLSKEGVTPSGLLFRKLLLWCLQKNGGHSMELKRWFNIPLKTDQKKMGGAAPTSDEVGVITVPQSTITFAAAPVTVTLVWKVLCSVIPSLSTCLWFPIILSLIVGMLIYFKSESPQTKKDKFLGFCFALINSFAIAATALGINTVASNKNPEPTKPGTQAMTVEYNNL